MEWMNRSEVLAGKVLAGQISPHAIDPSTLHAPFDQMIVELREGAGEVDLIDTVGMTALDGAKRAAVAMNGKIDLYVEACRESAVRVHAGRALDPIAKRWSMGESREGDVARAQEAIARMDDGKMLTAPLTEAPALKEVWQNTYYPPIDDNMFGVPKSSLTVVGGPPGTGKTSFLARLLINAAKAEKKVAFFSLEMTMAQIAHRFMQLDLTMKHRTKQERILVADNALTRQEIYSEAARVAANHPDLHLIGIDFADMIIPDSRSRAGAVETVDETYRTMAALAKQVNVPVIVLSQLNYQYVGGRPRVNHLRGSRLIEALAAMVVLLYNPDQIDIDQRDEELGYAGEDMGWFILGKSRYGFKYGGTIAVPVEWHGKTGWGDEYGQFQRLHAV